MDARIFRTMVTGVATLLGACGGGGGQEEEPPPVGPPVLYHVSGLVSGLGTSNLVLVLNGSEQLTVNGSTFTFATPLQPGSLYTVALQAHPAGLRCEPSTASGTVTPTSTISIECTPVIAFDLKTARAVIAGAQLVATASRRGQHKLEGTTNLVAVEADGTTHAALSASAPVRVMYSALDPSGEYLYLALRTPWHAGNDTSLAAFLGQGSCALYRVRLIDDSANCVAPFVWAQAMDELFRQAMSGNQKPIQFDAAGRVYFAAGTFSTDCLTESACTVTAERAAHEAEVYRYDPATTELVKLVEFPTPETERLGYFAVDASGAVVYSTNGPDGAPTGRLWRKLGDSAVDLTAGELEAQWFALAPAAGAALFGQLRFEYEPEFLQGVRLARVDDDLRRAVLDTRRFGTVNPSHSFRVPMPTRVAIADDGRVFGVTLGSTMSGGHDVFGVFQLLPYDPVPLYTISPLQPAPVGDPGGGGWWIHLGRGQTPLHVTDTHALLVEQIEHPDLGRVEAIRAISLADRSVRSFLAPDVASSSSHTVTSWRPSGDRLYLHTVDLARDMARLGHLDLAALAAGRPDSEVLVLSDVGPAEEGDTQAFDIEPLAVPAPQPPTGGATVTFHVDAANPYSLSLEFSHPMDRSSVEGALSVVDLDTAEVVTVFPLWVGYDLHLVPDRTGLDDGIVGPLQAGHRYRIEIRAGALTESGEPLSGATSIDLNLDP